MRRTVLLLATMALTLLVASGVALAVTKIGTNGPDTLRGTNGADNLVGKGGNDTLIALRGKDILLGAEGKDVLWGGTLRDSSVGDKNLVGGPGNDLVLGGKDSDNLLGQAGNDFLVDGEFRNPVKDNLSSGSGNDVLNVINVEPAGKDVVSCGRASTGYSPTGRTCSHPIARRCGSSAVLWMRLRSKNNRGSSPSRRASSKVCLGSREIGANLATEGG